ncbi:SusD/RagB family nutrient-binding outer membrane lipoprotein [Arcticibacter tournemirensis]|uniref:SusD/RagB family nutrient-binding outer membrane lipoprotein n=2 Tax=Pseudomonadati TaxID=3379134 RepID=A0A4Q0M6V4_9SPHI|nr:SusD/RagB family nutrient-binding outer membrane lipoprotein [Arcticibacter tournemirensis]RXF68801.1 SusD/RagB family nutrient-binding outer membrane lipoprotein [Arcticibacter tournemirensis]
MKSGYFKTYFSAALLVLVTGACSDQLDINDDPSRLTPDQVALSALLPATIQFTATSFFNAGQYGNYYPQYFAGSAGQEAQIDAYNPYGFDNIWESAYRDAMPNLKELIMRAEAAGAPQYAGIGKLLMALNLMQSSDIWGDLPYSEAFQGVDNLSPKYDSQQDIYMTHLKKLLDEAIDDLSKPIPALANLQVGSTDLIYKGTATGVANWMRAAYGARARYYLHLSGKDASNFGKAAADAAQSISDQSGALDLQLRYTQERPNPWFTYLSNATASARSAKPAEYFVNLLNGSSYYAGIMDPRISKLIDKGAAATYAGKPVGKVGGTGTTDITANTFYGQRTSVIPILTYSEMQFIIAESLFNTSKSDAYTAYINGIRGSMRKFGVSDSEINAYILNPAVAKTALTFTLTDIMLQKYIALFMQMESWTDMRRYQYSNTIYPNLKQPSVNVIGTWVQRGNFPDNEPGRNPNVPRSDQKTKLWLFN